MIRKFTRRATLIGASSALLLPACSRIGIDPDSSFDSRSDTTFLHGIASGDPDASSVVIWTRVNTRENTADIGWRLATDSQFDNVVAYGQYKTDASRDYTVKILVDNLEPGQTYFYQFDTNGLHSQVGQTKTLAVGHIESVVFAVATCSNYAFGYFNVYEAIANDPSIDLVVHLGDFIYEHGRDGYGGETGRRIGRDHEPRHEILNLADYRQRFAQYKTDAGSKAMHAKHPLIVMWDDHETANNPWMGGAQNHQDDEGDWRTRRTESLQAFYEWLPIREPKNGGSREEYWRHYKFGDLVSLITLESRHTGRSKQIDYEDHHGTINSQADADKFISTVLGAPGRGMLSEKMEQFLAVELNESVSANRRWRMLGNQSVLEKRTAPALDGPFFKKLENDLTGDARATLETLTELGRLKLPLDLDSWNGYPEAREDFYQIVKNAGVRDLLVLSGDSHSYWQNTLFAENGEPMGVELGATGITSPRSLLALGDEGLRHFDEMNAATNREVVWTDGHHRGFIRLTINHQQVHADFVTVDTVESRTYTVQSVHSVNIEHYGDTLRYV